MAEQFALQQSRGDGGTVHFYESPRPARAKIMDSTRNQLFSGTRFTINQHGGICRRHSLNLPQDTTEYGALADDLFKVSFGTDLVFEIKLFLSEVVLELSDLAVRERVLHGDGHLVCDLHQYLNIIQHIVISIVAGNGTHYMNYN